MIFKNIEKKYKMNNYYKLVKTLDERKKQFKMIQDFSDDRVPLICNLSDKMLQYDKEGNIITEKKFYKFLIEKENKLQEVLAILKRKMNLKEFEAIYFMNEKKELINIQKSMRLIYLENKDVDDELLYLYIFKENTFGKS